MENTEYICSQSSPQINIDEHDSNSRIDSINGIENSKNNKLFTTLSLDTKSEKGIDTIIESDTTTSNSNLQKNKNLFFYHSGGKSEPNLADCSLVPRSPSTAVQLDFSDLKNRDQDFIYSDKFHFNDSSSNVSYVSATSISMTHNSDSIKNTDEKKQEKSESIQEQPDINSKIQTQKKQSKQTNQSHQTNQPQGGKKIPKIPDIFYYSKKNPNQGSNKNNKLTYSWPKKRNQKSNSNHLSSSSHNRYTTSLYKQANKKV